MAWIDEQEPGIFDVDATQITQRYRNVQGVAFDGWLEILPREEVNRRLDVLLGYAESLGVDPTENPGTQIGILIVRGETDKAIEVALEKFFSESVAKNLDWRDTWLQPHYSDLTSDTRVQDAIVRWEEEETVLRGSVQSYFADMRASR